MVHPGFKNYAKVLQLQDAQFILLLLLLLLNGKTVIFHHLLLRAAGLRLHLHIVQFFKYITVLIPYRYIH